MVSFKTLNYKHQKNVNCTNWVGVTPRSGGGLFKITFLLCVKAGAMLYCLACSRFGALWEINSGCENSNLRFIGLMPRVLSECAMCGLCKLFLRVHLQAANRS